MSTHPIASPSGDLEDSIRWQRLIEVQRLCKVYLREPENVTDVGGVLSLVFTPNLTAPQTAILNRLIALSGIMRITPQEWQSIEADVAGLTTFQGLPVPPVGDPLRPLYLAIRAQNAIWKALLRS